MVTSFLRNPTLTSSEARSKLQDVRQVTVSTKTVRRKVKEAGIKTYLPARGPFLTTDHQVARANFARSYQNWNDDDWGKVLLTDKSTFCLKPDDRMIEA
ncbi:Transposable element Tcb2 transposase [Operophtera brumata]|uniref:Transposable element Tcb2 transposase n=1 Tax=Operophtera brumata TaxID=104452 RepID=A0A0L7LQE0_OPEBR|nr:Transposable element Tcb2 transposase [Operophtera brumata]